MDVTWLILKGDIGFIWGVIEGSFRGYRGFRDGGLGFRKMRVPLKGI